MLEVKSLDFEISFFERLVEESPNFVDALIPLAEAYTRKGLYAKGLHIDKRLAKICPKDSTVRYNLACSLALLGRKKEAFSALLSAIKLGYCDFEHLRKDPDLKSLHTEPQFKQLIA